MPYVSVIIPCYNASSYIHKCLKALEEQSFRDFEVILVDDCSTDETISCIERYQENSNLKLRYLRNERNMGPSIARKQGIDVATSKYIAFCDSDDWYESNYLELMVQKADINDADMVFCGYQTVSVKKEKEKTNSHLLPNIPSRLSVQNVLRFPIDSLWATMVKRSIIEGITFPDLRNGEDMAILPVLIAKSHSFGVVNQCLYNYLYRENSASMKSNDKVVQALIKSFAYVEANMSDKYEEQLEIIGIRNLIYGGLLSLFKYSYNVGKAKEILSDFEAKYPAWKENCFIKELPIYKRIFLKFAQRKVFVGLKILSIMHSLIVRN